MPKHAFIDVETTGTDHKVHGMVQLACILEIDNEVVLRREWKIRPFSNDQVDPQALKIHGLSEEAIREFPNPSIVKTDIDYELSKYVNRFDKQDKFFFIGYNSFFDNNFCRAWYLKCRDKYFGSYFAFPPIDVAGALAMKDPDLWLTLPDRKLVTVYKHFLPDEQPLQAHDALADIEATYKLWKLVQNGQ